MTDQTTFFSLLRTHFNPDELKTLCFTLGVDYDDLDTSRKSSLTRELVEHCHRHGQLPQLEATIRQQRPNILWPGPDDQTTPDPLNHHFQGLIQILSSDRYQLDSRFVQLTLLIDQGPDAQGLRYTPDNQRGKFNSLTTLLNETGEKALILLGQPGSGKTTLLRRLQLDHTWRELETLTQKPGFSPTDDAQPPLPKNPASPASAVAGLQTEPPTPPHFAFFAPSMPTGGTNPATHPRPRSPGWPVNGKTATLVYLISTVVSARGGSSCSWTA